MHSLLNTLSVSTCRRSCPCSNPPPHTCTRTGMASPRLASAGPRVPEQPVRPDRAAPGAARGALPVRAQLQPQRPGGLRARVPPVRRRVPPDQRHPPLPPGRGLRAGVLSPPASISPVLGLGALLLCSRWRLGWVCSGLLPGARRAVFLMACLQPEQLRWTAMLAWPGLTAWPGQWHHAQEHCQARKS